MITAMSIAPLPANESARLAALVDSGVLDTGPEREFDDLTRLASVLCAAPIALVTLVDERRAWFKARLGIASSEMPRDIAFCAHTILGNGLLVIEDTAADPRHATNPLVTAEPSLRFYAGVPLSVGGLNIGTLCVLDHHPRTLDAEQRERLDMLARQAAANLERHAATSREERMRRELVESASRDEQLFQAQKMEGVGRLAGGIAHDFNNLITVIVGYADLALGAAPAGHPLRARLEGIRRAADRAAELTRQLLAFSRKQVLRPRVIALGDSVRAMTPLLARLLGDDISLIIDILPTAAHVRADPAQLEQVLMNLVVNARDAMPRGGAIRIATGEGPGPPPDAQPSRAGLDAPAGWAYLAVSDTGVGIEPGIRAHIFEPFFTTKAPGKGTGLGLSTVFGVVAQSSGCVAVDSTPDRGSTFTVWLPAVPAMPGEATPAGDEVTAPSRGRVLLVEDNESVRAVAADALGGAGYAVTEAEDGPSALAIAQGREFDAVVADISMPGMSGIELVRRLLETRPRLRVLFMSGHSEEAIAQYGRIGEGEFIAKPFTPQELIDRVRGLVSPAVG
jgi:signal transduction histidine kinase/CheY-like chemotaxis protein